ncbi:hypothetical protein D3C72_2518690 [compost metagenome]
MTPANAAKGLIDTAKTHGKTYRVVLLPMGHNQMTESPDETLFALHDFLNGEPVLAF